MLRMTHIQPKEATGIKLKNEMTHAGEKE